MTDSFQEGAKLVRRDIDLCTFLPEIGVMKLMKVDGCTGGLYLAADRPAGKKYIGYDTSPTTVPCINPSDSFRMLGIYLSPSGSQHKQIKVLRTHADHFKAQIIPAHLTPDEAFIAYMVYIGPKLTYPLPCCSINQQHCKHIQAPALAGLLPKLNLNCHTPHTILFAGPKYGGLNIPELYTDEGFGKLKLLDIDTPVPPSNFYRLFQICLFPIFFYLCQMGRLQLVNIALAIHVPS
jgi:hypothetical protein